MNVKLELDLPTINLIVAGLAKLPYEQVVSLITYLANQVKEQSSTNQKEPTDEHPTV